MDDDTGSADDRLLRIRSRAVEWLDVDEQVVALDADRSVYLSTNASGALLWHHLVEGATTRQLVQALVTAYDIDKSDAAGDVEDFVSALSAHGLLEGPE